jgi:hypothetical protein
MHNAESTQAGQLRTWSSKWNVRNSDAQGRCPPQELEMTSKSQGSTFGQENPLHALASPTTAAHKEAEARITDNGAASHVSVDLDLGDHVDWEVSQPVYFIVRT